MKKVVYIVILFFPLFLIAQSKQIDIIYLNNGSVLKGTITEIVINESLTVTMDNGSIIKVNISDVKKIVKDQLVEPTNTDEASDNEDDEKRKEKGKFWEVLGDIAVATLDKTAENIENGNSEDTTTDDSPGESEEEEGNDENVGSICFINPNFYSRKIVLTNRSNGKEVTVLVGKGDYGKTTKSCSYDISAGIYECKVYTTFTKKMIEQYNIRINANDEASKELTKNQYN